MTQFVIGYDVTDPKRLAKVYRTLTGFAYPIAYSVFLFEGTAKQLDKHLSVVSGIIDVRYDDLRCYPLPQAGLKQRLGKASFPAGITLTALPACFLV